MKQLFSLLVLYPLLLLVPATSLAGPPTEVAHAQHYAGILISDKALNTSAATRTFSLDNFGADGDLHSYSRLRLVVKLTRSAATDVQMTCTLSHDSGTTDATVQRCPDSGGQSVCVDRTWIKDVAGSVTFPFLVDLGGADEVSCTFSGTSGGADDKITVTGWLQATPPLPEPLHFTAGDCIPTAGAAEEITSTAAASDSSTLLAAHARYTVICRQDVFLRWGDTAPTAALGDLEWPMQVPYVFATSEVRRYIAARNIAVGGSCLLLRCR